MCDSVRAAPENPGGRDVPGRGAETKRGTTREHPDLQPRAQDNQDPGPGPESQSKLSVIPSSLALPPQDKQLLPYQSPHREPHSLQDPRQLRDLPLRGEATTKQKTQLGAS